MTLWQGEATADFYGNIDRTSYNPFGLLSNYVEEFLNVDVLDIKLSYVLNNNKPNIFFKYTINSRTKKNPRFILGQKLLWLSNSNFLLFYNGTTEQK